MDPESELDAVLHEYDDRFMSALPEGLLHRSLHAGPPACRLSSVPREDTCH